MKKNIILSALAILISAIFLGCNKGDNCVSCCKDSVVKILRSPNQDTDSTVVPFNLFTGTLNNQSYHFFYLPGTPQRVQFFVGETRDNICTESHLSILYDVKTTSITHDRKVKILGEAYWSTFSDDVVARDDILEPNKTYLGELADVGLKQAFPKGAATVDFYLTVEFESLGSYKLDKAYFQQHFSAMNILCVYREF